MGLQPENDKSPQMKPMTPEVTALGLLLPRQHGGAPGAWTAKSNGLRAVGGQSWLLSACQHPQASPDYKIPENYRSARVT